VRAERVRFVDDHEATVPRSERDDVCQRTHRPVVAVDGVGDHDAGALGLQERFERRGVVVGKTTWRGPAREKAVPERSVRARVDVDPSAGAGDRLQKPEVRAISPFRAPNGAAAAI
jgi:hypothetical protein